MSPAMPQKEAGLRIDPPVSVPSAPITSPAATADAEPVLEPPVNPCSGFHGFRTAGQAWSVEGLP